MQYRNYNNRIDLDAVLNGIKKTSKDDTVKYINTIKNVNGYKVLIRRVKNGMVEWYDIHDSTLYLSPIYDSNYCIIRGERYEIER